MAGDCKLASEESPEPSVLQRHGVAKTHLDTVIYSNPTQIQKSGSSDLSEKTTELRRQRFPIQSQFQQDVPLHQITDHPVLEQLFTVEERPVPAKGTAKGHFSSLPRTAKGFPLSYSQERPVVIGSGKARKHHPSRGASH